MRISTLMLTGAAFGALSAMTAFPASAAVLSVAQVTVGCPDIDQARECPVLAEEYLSGRPFGPQSDSEIVSLVLAIAELSQVPRVTMPVCLNAAEGLRVLALGVSTQDQQVQIEDIADSLCDNTTTAAIRRGIADLESLAGSSGGAGVADTGTGNTGDEVDLDDNVDDQDDEDNAGGDDGDDGDAGDHDNGHGNEGDHDDGSNPATGGDEGDDSEEEVEGTGLGSNDAAAGRASANGESNANQNARDNISGNNGN